MSVKPFQNLTLTANNQTVTASFDAPATGWDRTNSYGNHDFATDSGFSSNVTSSNNHPSAGTMRESDFPFTVIVGQNLSPSTTYYYRVRHANRSGLSNYLSGNVTTAAAPVTAPSAPGQPTLSSITVSAITISWSAVATATSYKVYAGTSSNPTSLITTTANTTHTQTGLNANTTYYARLKASNGGGDSGYGTQASATTLPGTPANLAASQGSAEGEIDLSWDQTVGGGGLTVTYTIQRATSSGGTFSSIATSIASGTTTFTDTGLDGSTTFYYKILAVTSAGSSAASSEVNATTLATTGPNPSNEVLEFGKLNVLVNRGSDGAEVSMNDVTGNTSEASLKDFYVGGFTSISAPSSTIVGSSGHLTITANFSNAGDRFKDKINTSRFSWSITSGGSNASLSNESGRTVRLTTAGNFGAYTVTVSCTWTPIFNDHVTSNLTRTADFTMQNV